MSHVCLENKKNRNSLYILMKNITNNFTLDDSLLIALNKYS